MAKRLVVFALFLGVALTMFMIDPITPIPGDTSDANASGLSEAASRAAAPNWLITPVEAVSASLEKGRRIFMRDCARCHGPRGDGASSIAGTLHPAPFDLTSFELADSFIMRAVREGVPGSDMPGWRLGSDEDVRAVSTFTATLARRDALAPQDGYAPPQVLREAGRRVYVAHCTTCHGEQGRGDGPDAARHLPAPASFSDMRPSYAAALRAIESGVHGTAMPSWPLLTAPEIQAVTFYIRTLYTNPANAAGVKP